MELAIPKLRAGSYFPEWLLPPTPSEQLREPADLEDLADLVPYPHR